MKNRYAVAACAFALASLAGSPVLSSDALPAAAATRAPPPSLEAYGALPAVDTMSLSHSGSRLVYITRNGDSLTLVATELGKGRLAQINLGEIKVGSVVWAGEDIILLERLTTQHLIAGSKALYASWLIINLKTGHNEWVLGSERNSLAVDYMSNPKLIDGRWYGFFGANNQDSEFALIKVDLETNKGQEIARPTEGEVTHWLIGPDGKPVARSEYSQKTGLYRAISMLGAGQIYQKVRPVHEATMQGFGRTPDTVIIGDAADDGSIVYNEVSLTKPGVSTRLAGDDVSAPLHGSNGLLIGWLTNANLEKYFDPALEIRYLNARKPFSDYTFTLETESDDLGKVIGKTDAGDDSGTYWLIDLNTGKAEPIAQDYARITAEQVGRTQVFDYKAADGLAMDGVLTLPPGRQPKNLPVVVMPHGGPIVDRDRPGFDFWAQAFASRGYAVFQPNYRGTEGYGSAFRHAADGQWGKKMQTDISDGLAALAKAGIVDPKRACIVGASYGGYAALAGVTLQHGIYRCAVSDAGISDLHKMLSHDDSELDNDTDEVGRWWRKLMGVSYGGEAAVRALSPIEHVREIDAPVLLTHGDEDTVVRIEQSQMMYDAMRRAGKSVEFITLKGEQHYLYNTATRTQLVKVTVEFVMKHNPPD